MNLKAVRSRFDFERVFKVLKRSFKNLFLASNSWPTVTVVTPVLNARETIEETVQSVLNQGYPKLQYIIQDGGSTDGTLELLKKYEGRVVIRTERDDGMYDALRRAFALADGDVMGYINADDVMLPGGLWKIAEVFSKRTKVDVIYHEDVILTHSWVTPNISQPRSLHPFDFLFRAHILFQDGVWWRRHCYLETGGFNPKFKLAGDFDLWLRMILKFKFTKVKGHVSGFRKRPGQLSENMTDYFKEAQQSQESAKRGLNTFDYLKLAFSYLFCRFARLVSLPTHERHHFPLNPGFALPSMNIPGQMSPNLRCPLTNRPPDRLLFSSPETRFGSGVGTRLWKFDQSGVGVADPPLCQGQLDSMYESLYSGEPKLITLPSPGVMSPYQHFKGRRGLHSICSKAILPRKVSFRLTSPFEPWHHTTCKEVLSALNGSADLRNPDVSFLDVGCFSGDLLDQIGTHTSWKLAGAESNPIAAAEAKQKGHMIYPCRAEDLFLHIPRTERFDVIYLGQVIEHLLDPYQFCKQVKSLLKPHGLLILTTPNLDSVQIDLFGPCWSHWHPPFHRYIFSPRGLRLLGEDAGLKMQALTSHSYPGWTLLSQKLSSLGLGGSVHHAYNYTEEEMRKAASFTAWQRLFWNWRNRGDSLLGVFSLR